MSDADNRPAPVNTEAGARFSAALAYAGMTYSDAAQLLGVGKRQVGRYASGQSLLDAHDPRMQELAERTGVPLWFLADGWDGSPEVEAPSVAERVEALERKVDALARRPALSPSDLRALRARLPAGLDQADGQDQPETPPSRAAGGRQPGPA